MQNSHPINETAAPLEIHESPGQLILLAYNLAIGAIERQDADRAYQVVLALKDVLSNNYGESANSLLNQYEWCLSRIQDGDYDSARSTLKELRTAWVRIEKKLT